MAPSKAKTPAKVYGRDIRGFFGGAGSSQTTPSTQHTTGTVSKHFGGPSQTQSIEISDGEDARTSKKPPASCSAKPEKVETKLKSERVMDDEEDQKPQPSLKRKKAVLAFSSEDEDEDLKKVSPPRKKHAIETSSSKASSSGFAAKPKPRGQEAPHSGKQPPRKAKKNKDEDFEMLSSEDVANDDDYIEDEDDEAPAKKGKSKVKTTPKKALVKAQTAKSTGKAKASANGEEQEKPKPKFNWAAAKAAKLAGPIAPGSKSVPEPAVADPLGGLSFVFTGELSSFSREEAISLAKRFGGRVTLQPSSKTSFVVLGSDAGPSKLAAIKKNNLKTLDEDGFLDLIATRVPDTSNLDDKTKKKLEKEKEAIRQGAAEMEKREKKAMKESVANGGSASAQRAPSSQLWAARYAPQSLKEICGNKGQVEKLQMWLNDWSSSLHSGFKKPGKNGMNIYRAVLITGPPGIGKTTSAHLCAKLAGFTPIELNASDARSKKLVENSTNITNASLDGWMTGGHMANTVGVNITDKSCLIMDEVDGMSAGDRGGVGALAALIKKTKIPIICIANDRTAQKLKPLINATFNLTFRKPEVTAIRSRLLTIAFKEKMKVPANVIDQLIEGAQSDIRQVLNMLSTWKLSNDTMNFDEGKTLAKMNEKYSVMTPFNVINKMLGPYMFSPTSRERLNDKIELYFHDPSFIPLFIEENYLKTQPSKVKNMDGPEKVLKQLELMDNAASSISDGDLVDTLIHGVRPASLLYGPGVGYGGQNAMSFPQWLGQNSKQGKLSRQLTDIQARMRLKVSGDKPEIRQSYLPALFPHIVKPLMDEGASAVDDVIERMDEYFLTREDWDTVVELGLDEHKDDLVLKKISTATKTSLTRKYNSRDHPIPFHKAQDLGKVPKKLAALGPAPDLEEAFDVEEDIVEESEDKPSSNDDDVTHDSLIKAPKKGKGTVSSKGKAIAQPKIKARAKKT
ncbi:replication factor RFC1 C terminal domain-containing protein [Sparassis latifolia]